MTVNKLSYPVGVFAATTNPDRPTLQAWVKTLETFPRQMREATATLDDDALRWRYRPGGWTIRQVVHHCADSHINAYTRFKLALTEENPDIKPYDEAAWAELPDSQLPIAISLNLLESLHQRWCTLLKGMSEADFKRTFAHPEHGTVFSLTLALDNYDWHCRHHLAHIHQAIEHRFAE